MYMYISWLHVRWWNLFGALNDDVFLGQDPMFQGLSLTKDLICCVVTYVYIHIDICVNLCIYIYVYIYVYIYTCTYLHVYTYICMYIYVCTCTHIYMYVCMYVYIYTHMYTHMCICICICICMCICMYTYMFLTLCCDTFSPHWPRTLSFSASMNLSSAPVGVSDLRIDEERLVDIPSNFGNCDPQWLWAQICFGKSGS